jgi:hypothetical protein
VRIESSCVNPPIRVIMAVGFIRASRRCHSLDSGIVRDFSVDLVLSVEGALRTEEAGGFVDAIVGVYEDLIEGLVVGSVISSLQSELSLFHLFPLSVVDDRSAVAGTMMYMPLNSLPARLLEDGKVMDNLPFRNIVVGPAKSNWLIDKRESRKVAVWRAST